MIATQFSASETQRVVIMDALSRITILTLFKNQLICLAYQLEGKEIHMLIFNLYVLKADE